MSYIYIKALAAQQGCKNTYLLKHKSIKQLTELKKI